MREKNAVYVDFIDLEMVYNIVNRGALWQVLSIYGVAGKLVSGVKSMHIDSLTCVRV